MTTVGPTPEEAGRSSLGAGLPLAEDHRPLVAQTVGGFQVVLARLRDIDFGETRPAAAYRAQEGNTWCGPLRRRR